MKLLFLDTETTGLEPNTHGIVQLSGIIEIDGEVKEEFDFNCKPFEGQLFTHEALQIIGKTKEEIMAYPEPGIVYALLMKILNKYINRYDKNDKFYLVGQNIKFDYDHMDAWFKRNNNKFFYAYIAYHLIDIIGITMLFTLAGLIKTKNLKLATVAEYYGIEFKAHDSMEDIRVTKQIFHKFIDHVKGQNQDMILSQKGGDAQ